jgi:hypothetical protein
MAYVIYKIDTANGSHGLLPDWVNSTDLNHPKQSISKETQASDRGDLPYNCYYDAVRVPWRLSLCTSWYNTTYARNIPSRLLAFIEHEAGGLENVKDGYMPNGDPFSFYFADWNNVYDYYKDKYGVYHDGHWSRNPKPSDVNTFKNRRGEEVVMGGLHGSPTFTAMFATVYGASPKSTTGDSTRRMAYEMVKASKEPYINNSSSPFNYYGNTLRLLSLLYLSGNMKNLYTCDWKYLLYAPTGVLKGTKNGNFLIKNMANGTYLARNGNNIVLVKGFLEDLGPDAWWRIIDDDNDGYCILLNVGAGMTGSPNLYLNYPSGVRGDCSLASTYNSYGLWQLYDNGGGNTRFVLNPKSNTKFRIFATSPSTVTINKNTSGEKYFQIIQNY